MRFFILYTDFDVFCVSTLEYAGHFLSVAQELKTVPTKRSRHSA
jgi:hypothetical protein